MDQNQDGRQPTGVHRSGPKPRWPPAEGGPPKWARTKMAASRRGSTEVGQNQDGRQPTGVHRSGPEPRWPPADGGPPKWARTKMAASRRGSTEVDSGMDGHECETENKLTDLHARVRTTARVVNAPYSAEGACERAARHRARMTFSDLQRRRHRQPATRGRRDGTDKLHRGALLQHESNLKTRRKKRRRLSQQSAMYSAVAGRNTK